MKKATITVRADSLAEIVTALGTITERIGDDCHDYTDYGDGWQYEFKVEDVE